MVIISNFCLLMQAYGTRARDTTIANTLKSSANKLLANTYLYVKYLLIFGLETIARKMDLY